MKHRYSIASVLLISVAGCAAPGPDATGAWKIEPVFNVMHTIQSSQAYYTLGRYHDGSKAWGRAIDAYRKAIAIDAQNIEAYNALGVALAQSGVLVEAETVLRKAISKAPSLTHVRSNLGYVLLLAGKPVDAVVELEAAVLLDRDNAPAATNLRDALAIRDAARGTTVQASATSAAQPVKVAFSNASDTVLVTRKGVAAAAEGPTRIDVSALHVVDQPTVEWNRDRVTVGAGPVSATAKAVPAGAADPVAMALAPLLPLSKSGKPASRFEVCNGNGVAGMAASVGRWLAAQGLKADRLTDRKPFNQQKTLIQFRKGHEEAAQRMAASLPANAKALLVPTQDLQTDVRMVLGRDWALTVNCLGSNTCQRNVTAVLAANDR